MLAYDRPLIPIYPCLSFISLFRSMLEASVPSSIKSIFVITPMVHSPVGSSLMAIFKASEFDKSILAGITHNIKVSLFSQYYFTNSLVSFSIF